jgi:ABC-type uncharacterized transport system ATPase subunit
MAVNDAGIEARSRGSVIVSSHRLHDLAGLCDAYLFLLRIDGAAQSP